MKYIAKEGCVFDDAEPQYDEDENGEKVERHLYATVLWLGVNDSIDNYKEVEAVK